MSNKQLPALPEPDGWEQISPTPSSPPGHRLWWGEAKMRAMYAQGRASRDAEVEALRALLIEARDTIDTLPGYPKGADLCDRIEDALGLARGATTQPAEPQVDHWQQKANDAKAEFFARPVPQPAEPAREPLTQEAKLSLTDQQCEDAIRAAGLWPMACVDWPRNRALLMGLCRAAHGIGTTGGSNA